MTDPAGGPGPTEPTGAPGPLGPPEADDDVAVVVDVLDRAGPRRVAAVIGAVRVGVRALCWMAGGAGAAALLLGLAAWGETPAAAVLIVAFGAVAIGIPVYVARRSSVLVEAVAHPGEVVAEAKDLLARAKGSPELHQLAGRVRRRQAVPARQIGKVRRVLRSGRMISAVIGLADPDPVRHRLLVPFTPVRMRALWLAILAGLWVWLAAGIVACVAGLDLILGAL